MSFYWLQHAFLMVTIVVILMLILDVCVSKLKIFLFYFISNFQKHPSDYADNARSCIFHLVDVINKENLTQVFRSIHDE